MAEFNPTWCVAPGATLKEWCEEHSMSYEQTAEACRHMKPDTFESIVRGSIEITPQLAGALQAGTAVGAKVWLNLERQYRESLEGGDRETHS